MNPIALPLLVTALSLAGDVHASVIEDPAPTRLGETTPPPDATMYAVVRRGCLGVKTDTACVMPTMWCQDTFLCGPWLETSNWYLCGACFGFWW